MGRRGARRLLARCADRAYAYAAGLSGWEPAIEPTAARSPAAIGFIAARIAEARDGIEAYHAERSLQVAWFDEFLGL